MIENSFFHYVVRDEGLKNALEVIVGKFRVSISDISRIYKQFDMDSVAELRDFNIAQKLIAIDSEYDCVDEPELNPVGSAVQSKDQVKLELVELAKPVEVGAVGLVKLEAKKG